MTVIMIDACTQTEADASDACTQTDNCDVMDACYQTEWELKVTHVSYCYPVCACAKGVKQLFCMPLSVGTKIVSLGNLGI